MKFLLLILAIVQYYCKVFFIKKVKEIYILNFWSYNKTKNNWVNKKK